MAEQSKKKAQPNRSKLHPRNKHTGRYDLAALAKAVPKLEAHIKPNRYNNDSIDFADAEAVRMLNKALLKHQYEVDYWELPADYLCPPIPGRADYIHHIADVLAIANGGEPPHGNRVKCLDIGVGASCIYPILGFKEYGWSFIASDIDEVALKSAASIAEKNGDLSAHVDFRMQPNAANTLTGVLAKGERIDLTICNPPFHSSSETAAAGSLRKVRNLGKLRVTQAPLNFGGQPTELWCEGGENQFVKGLIRESLRYSTSSLWFSTLVSKQSNLKGVYKALEEAKAQDVKTVPMGQGNKTSRIVAWTFVKRSARREWAANHWK